MRKKATVNPKRFQWRWEVSLKYLGEVESTEYAYGRTNGIRKAIELCNEKWGARCWNVSERRKGYIRYNPIKDAGIITLEQVPNPHWQGNKAKPAVKKEDPDRDPGNEKQLHRPTALLVDFVEDKLLRSTKPVISKKTRQDLPMEDRIVALLQMPLKAFSVGKTGKTKRYNFTLLVDGGGRAWMPIIWLPDVELAALVIDLPDEVEDVLAWRAMLDAKAETKKNK